MLAAYLFDRKRGDGVDDWQSRADHLRSHEVVWVDLQSPTEEELSSVWTAFSIREAQDHHRSGREASPQVHMHDEYIHVTSIMAMSDEKSVANASVLESLVGENWVVTIHDAKSGLVDDFRELATGPGQLGGLDAPSFLATLLELVVISYVEEFADIEATVEDFDAEVMGSQDRDFEGKVAVLVKPESTDGLRGVGAVGG